MLKHVLQIIERYSSSDAPFMHGLIHEWGKTKPLQGLNILTNTPVVPNTLLQITALHSAGAKLTVCNPSFMLPHKASIAALQSDGIPTFLNANELSGKSFDIFLDCMGELYQKVGVPRIGAVELTGSGDVFYRAQKLTFPVVSIDKTLTKQLETIFGMAESAISALKQLTQVNDFSKKRWLVFGFGKIGRGIAYYCMKNNASINVVEPNETIRKSAELLGIRAIDPDDYTALQSHLTLTDVVITATGKANVLKQYPKKWFENKILANLGVLDEFGDQFSENEVLNNKIAINFSLDDPTPIEYFDPEIYADSIAINQLLKEKLSNEVHDLPKAIDHTIIQKWCQHHKINYSEIEKWFIKF